MRKINEELQAILKRENCKRLWSWSRLECFRNSPYEYFLNYIKHEPKDRQNCIYAPIGSVAHEALELYYTNQINRDKMLESFEDGWFNATTILDLKFDRNDESKNETIKQKYYIDLQLFFKNHRDIKRYKPLMEQFIKYKIDDNLFQGYIDCCFKDESGCFNIIDFKTSTMYTGKTLIEHSGQLTVYAMGLMQAGIPKDKIKIGFNFLKYCTVTYTQANGKTKDRNVERSKLGESLQTNVKMWLNKNGYSEGDTDFYLKQLIDSNNISVLPEDVCSKYIMNDCYVFIPFDDALRDKWIDIIRKTIKDIELRESDYKTDFNEKVFYDTDEQLKSQSYYLATLCEYSIEKHKPYKEWLDKIDDKKNGFGLFDNVGINSSSLSVADKNISNDRSQNDDLSWLDDII